uniref:Membrane-associated progesterone receptor component 2 isoform X2 n=1 Tax=Geotrypetes seraphini TaxID=260995 RepID=A0A6P8R4P2_GEOSA|nr:membrane-associated progesterone receptor component 2 isoform X2 [Geotrypetes seraphini]
MADGEADPLLLSSRAAEDAGPGEAAAAMLLNVGLLALLCLVAYKLYLRWWERPSALRAARDVQASSLPKMKRRDFTLAQLRDYDGAADSRLLMAVNGKVFDVTKGSKFYGPEGPYGIFAGRDASRGLATFCLDKHALRDEYDDLSDLNAVQMESVREWEMQIKGGWMDFLLLLVSSSAQQGLQERNMIMWVDC